MKFNDLYDFIMENIPEEEWEAFYSVEPVENVNYIGNASHFFDEIKCSYVFARQTDTDNKNIYFFNDNVHGEAWRKQFFGTFFTEYDIRKIKISKPDEQFKKEMICYLISEYLHSGYCYKSEFYIEKLDVFAGILKQIPDNLCSYLGTRKHTAICTEYWVYSKYDSDEKMPEIISKDNRFKGEKEKQVVLDLILSIRDFFKHYPFIGVERKAA